ncbi:MAG: hypothetical protein ACJ76U_17200 [Gaiellaceae bacterium]
MAVTVVNMIPNSLSNETFQDSEPNLAVNPANPLEIAGTAFTVDPGGGSNAPIFVSTDGGNTWSLNLILPGVAGSFVGTFDITLRFAASGLLYLAFLRQPSTGLRLDVMRTANFATPSPAPTILVDADTSPGPDQPFLQAATQLGGNGASRDHVYIGDNDRPGTSTRTSTVEFSNDAANAAPPSPAGFVKRIVESRGTLFQDAPQVRPAIHPDGTVYVAFSAWRTSIAGGHGCDIVVVRDDSWATGASPFSALSEPPAPTGDGSVGVRVARGVPVPFFAFIGQQRIGGDVAIAIDPRDSSNVYIAWGDTTGGTYTIRVRRSQDRGATWSGDLRTITNATNASLAINSRGVLGLLYQQVTGTGASQRWVTHLERTSNDFGTITDLVLATVPASTPGKSFDPYIGDYAYVLALGKTFYGIFSANNTPDPANFPNGVTFQRNRNAATKTLRGVDGVTTIPASIDPFFFKVTTIDPNRDFYVRDWTDNPTSGDNGVEPSTHPYFFISSDVWNRRSNAPGAFNANDQPANEDPRNGPGVHGRNWAFARIRRNASGVADTVTAKFLVAEFGTGSNYQAAGSATGTPVPFAAGDLVKTAPSHQWQLAATSSTHLCLAVEISTATDPIVPPSLLGHAPGWPTTDLMVLNGNKKAQRNIGVYPASGSTPLEYYVLVHNAALFLRDIVLEYAIDPLALKFIRELQLAEVGGKGRATKQSGTLLIRGVQPGENRWVRITLPAVAKAQGPLPVVFYENHNGVRVNGFAVAPQPTAPDVAGGANVRFHADVLNRAAAIFSLPEAAKAAEAALKSIPKGRIAPATYATFLKRGLPLLEDIAKHVAADDPRDVFAIARNADALGTSLGRATAAPNAHANLLHALDARMTATQKSLGDPADIVQTIERMLDVLRRRKRTAVLQAVAKASTSFVNGYEHGRVGTDAYPAYVRGVLPALEKLGPRNKAVTEALEQVKANLGNVQRLQRAHQQLVSAIDA